MRAALLSILALPLAGCITSPDNYVSASVDRDQKARDYAGCELEVERIKPESTFVIGDGVRRVMNACMRSKGYTVVD
jgi:starvation-inducible outer membrane lipoprotein